MHKAWVSTPLPDSKSILLNNCESKKHKQMEMSQFAGGGGNSRDSISSAEQSFREYDGRGCELNYPCQPLFISYPVFLSQPLFFIIIILNSVTEHLLSGEHHGRSTIKCSFFSHSRILWSKGHFIEKETNSWKIK